MPPSAGRAERVAVIRAIKGNERVALRPPFCFQYCKAMRTADSMAVEPLSVKKARVIFPPGTRSTSSFASSNRRFVGEAEERGVRHLAELFDDGRVDHRVVVAVDVGPDRGSCRRDTRGRAGHAGRSRGRSPAAVAHAPARTTGCIGVKGCQRWRLSIWARSVTD
jgi:hypothetical protein